MAPIVNAMDDKIIFCAPDGRILFANNAFAEHFRYKVPEVKKMSVKQLVDLGSSDFKDLLSEVIVLRSFRVKDRKGKWHEHHGAVFTSVADSDKPGFAVVIPTNDRSFESLKKKLDEDILLKVINHRTDAIWFCSDIVNRKILFISKSILSVCGYTNAEIYTGGWMFFLTCVHKEDRIRLIEGHWKWLQEKNKVGKMIDHLPFHMFLRFRTKNGTYLRMDVEYNVQTRKDQHVHLVFGSYRPLPEGTELTRDTIAQINGRTFIDLNFLKTLNSGSAKPAGSLPSLTQREEQVLRLMTEGESSEDIARTLFVSIHTVNQYRKQIMKKFDAKNLADLVRKYISAI